MNGRAYPGALAPAPAAVDRSSTGPVLAWNVEPTQFPAGTYPEMPTAAAAAVSPVVPTAATAAAPPDPYGRCWQNQVDPGACFPYFGTLYGSSLPPPSYRVQPGCVSNLGQFWPPTPPPEGCVRFEGTNNLHYCSPLTPVFRHGESLPQNMLGVHQRLNHYSHLIDVNKDPGLKRPDSCSDTAQRQKVAVSSKHGKEGHQQQQRLCHCYECTEKCASRSATQSVNKENISTPNKLLEQRYLDEKSKGSRNCKKIKNDCFTVGSHGRSSVHANESAISNYSCSVDQSMGKSLSSMQATGLSVSGSNGSQKENSTPVSGSYAQYDFLRPDSKHLHSTRCSSNSALTVSSCDASVVHSEARASEQARYENSAEKGQHKLHVSAPCCGPCMCPAVQASSSGSKCQHSAENSCCFSPPYLSSRTLYQNYPENSVHSKAPNTFVMYGNGYNASPLKNVYFSYYESENFEQASSVSSDRKHNRDNLGKIEKNQNHTCNDNRLAASLENVRGYPPPPLPLPANSCSSRSSCSYSLNSQSRSHRDGNIVVPTTSHGCMYQSASTEQLKSTSIARYLNSSGSKRSEPSPYCERGLKVNPAHIKQEKLDSPDCKYQRSHSNSSSRYQPSPVSVATSGVLNLSTSVRYPKIEPEDCTSTSLSEHCIAAASPLNSPSTYTYSNASIKSNTSTSAQVARPEELKYSETERRYILSPSVVGSPAQCQVPGTSSLQMQVMENDCAPAVPEDLVSVMQVKPLSGAESAILNEMPTAGSEAPDEVSHESKCVEPDEGSAATESKVDSPCTEPPDLTKAVSNDVDNSGPPSLAEQVCSGGDTADIDQQVDCVHELLPPKLEQHCDPPSVRNTVKDPEPASPKSECCGNSDDRSQKVSNVQETDSCMKGDVQEPDLLKCDKSPAEKCKDQSDKSLEPELSDKIAEDEQVVESSEKAAETDSSGPMQDDDCRGLYLLLEGIEHRSNTNQSNEEKPPTKDDDDSENDLCTKISNLGADAPQNNMNERKLNALCAFVEQQFAVEFGDHLRISSPVQQHEEPEGQDIQSTVISNYPVVKCEEPEEKPACAPSQSSEPNASKASSTVQHASSNSSSDGSSEQEMRKKLAELQQKYKEKQKELARLKPKKTKTSSALDVSRLSDASCASNNSSCNSSLSSSKDEVHSAPEHTPEKRNFELDFTAHKFNNLAAGGNAKLPAGKEAVNNTLTRFCSQQSPRGKQQPGNQLCKSPRSPRSRSVVNRKLKLRSDKRSRKILCCRTSRHSMSSRSRTNEVNNSLASSASDDLKSRISSSSEQTISDIKSVQGSVKHSSGKRKLQKCKEPKACEKESSKNKHKNLPDFAVPVKQQCSEPSVGKSPKKRKSEHPQRYMPAKQVRLTETIIAKQLRNRILFESPGSAPCKSPEKYDFPEELSDALRKCHLGEGDNCGRKSSESWNLPIVSDSLKRCAPLVSSAKVCNLKMAVEHLVENTRILAMEDGLFYAGCIKEVQSPDLYAIALDGQRGNKKHIFSQEEMLTQTILELKPSSTDELPEGTRVCAYWSHQYRCLYPGTVVKAPTPSADWSEPRVFVEFDDGDSAQIAMKNIRFLPGDIPPSEEESKESQSEVPPFASKEESSETKRNSERKKRKGRTKGLKKHSKSKNDRAGTSQTDIQHDRNPSRMELSESLDDTSEVLDGTSRNCDDEDESLSKKVLKRTLRQQAKRKLEGKGKLKENCSPPEKKKHKKYKDRHKHHHHHRHHRHHHKHCHHHRHCKKHKHHKRASNIDNIINVVIPSTSIPLGSLITKSTRNSVKEAETQCVGHSKNDKLPQISCAAAALSSEANAISDKLLNKKESSNSR